MDGRFRLSLPSPRATSEVPSSLVKKRIVVVLLGALILSGILGALVLYRLFGEGTGPQIPPPVSFGPAHETGEGIFECPILLVRREETLFGYDGSEPLGYHAVQLMNDSTSYGGAIAVFPNRLTVVDGHLGQGHGVVLSFQDRSEAGTLSPGDAFVLDGVAPGTSFVLVLFSREAGHQLAAMTIP